MSKKSPALLFYTKDWITGTAEMEPAEKGLYIDLISYQHINGSIPSEEKKLAKLCGLSLDEFIEIWKGIKHKFVLNGNRLVNQKVQQVVDQTNERALKNKINGSLPRIIEKFELKKDEKRKVYQLINKSINYEEYIGKNDNEIKETLNLLVEQTVNYIVNVNANVNEDANTLEERKEKFKKEVLFFLDEYSKSMLNKFTEYWTELNKPKTKMKFELQQTWETGKRLATWKSKDFDKPGKVESSFDD